MVLHLMHRVHKDQHISKQVKETLELVIKLLQRVLEIWGLKQEDLGITLEINCRVTNVVAIIELNSVTNRNLTEQKIHTPKCQEKHKCY